MGRLDNKVAIITGASMGMGRAAAIRFAKEGAKVVVADCAVEAGEETVRLIKEAGGESIFVKADVTKAPEVAAMVKTAVDTYQRLDVLFNNAGIIGKVAVTAECEEENWDAVLTVNLKGTFLGMKYAIPEMLKTGGGSIINTASGAAVQPVVGLAAYTASKGGVIALTRVTAMEYLRKNIRTNYIVPGCILTTMNAPFKERMRRQVPLGRLGKPEEVAHVALFLASDESSHITASGVTVDGGLTAYGPIILSEEVDGDGIKMTMA